MPIDDALAQLEPSINPIKESSKLFYIFDKMQIRKLTTESLISKLQENNYMNLDSAYTLVIGKKVVKATPEIKDLAKLYIIKISQARDKYYPSSEPVGIKSISHENAKKIAMHLGYKLPSIDLMYDLFIPWLKKSVVLSDEAITLEAMKYYLGEWLEEKNMYRRSGQDVGNWSDENNQYSKIGREFTLSKYESEFDLGHWEIGFRLVKVYT